jgi:transcription elongation factor GreA
MSSISYYTPEGFKKLKEELEFLKSVERPRVSAQIAEARDKGDLSENAEYDAAKEAQGLLELKISKMDDLMANARIMEASQMDNSKVFVLSTVKIKNLKNGMELKYTLVAEQEADLKLGLINISSPIARALIGKEEGDVAEVQAPGGVRRYEIVGVSYV